MLFLTPRGPVEMVQVCLANAILELEVVRTPQALEKGLMDRPELRWSSGMWFVWPTRAVQSMWMKNVRFPLDILWMDGSTVAGIHPRAEAYSTVTRPSFRPVTGAIEVNAGWCEDRRVRVGDVVWPVA